MRSLTFIASLSFMSLSTKTLAFNSPAATGSRLSGTLVLQETEYETDDGDSADVEGQLLQFGYRTQISSKFAIGGGLGLMLDGEFSDRTKVSDGQGFRLSLDGDFELTQFSRNQLLLNFVLTHDRFTFDSLPGGGTLDHDFQATELRFGGLILRKIDQLSLYGGLELTAYSNAEIETRFEAFDLERDDRLNLRLGLSYAATRDLNLRADLILIGEQTIVLGADFAI